MSPLPSRVMTAGWILVAVCFVWWMVFFARVAQVTGDNTVQLVSKVIPCLVITTQPCGIVYFGAQVAGYLPYKPEVMWLGLALIAVGFFWEHFNTSNSAQMSSSKPEVADAGPFYDVAKWNALLRYDDELAKVAALFQPLGKKWSDRLAADYLAINDKAYLPQIARKIMADVKAERDLGANPPC